MEALARPDLEAFDHAVGVEFHVAVKELVDLLGPKLVAFLSGVKETRAVREWAEGSRSPRDHLTEDVIRFALRVARFIADNDNPRVAQAWFQGLNPQLDDRSPARMMREGEIDEVGPQVLAAARAFVSGG